MKEKNQTEFMRIVLILFLITSGIFSFSQTDTIPKIDLIIYVSDQESGAPWVNAKVILTGSDGLSVIGYTNADGMIEYLHTNDSVRIKPGNNYTIEVEGVLKQYLGTSDAFSTVGITQNTRIIRDLKTLIICRRGTRFPFLHFDPNDATISNSSADSLNYLHDLLIEHPTIIVEVAAFYETESQKKLAMKRANAVVEKMNSMGMPAERFTVKIYLKPENDWYQNVDVEFKILSFDYVPE